MMIKIGKYLIRKTNILITFSLHYLSTQFGSFFHLAKVHMMNLIILIGLLPLVTVSFFTFEYKTFAEICTYVLLTLVALIAVSTRVFVLKKISTQHGLIRNHTFIKIFENFFSHHLQNLSKWK